MEPRKLTKEDIDKVRSIEGFPIGTDDYHREPFASDVSEGKNDPLYAVHTYHTKVPYKAIINYILHYSDPGDIVFDGFAGTGMTGVAAKACGGLGKPSFCPVSCLVLLGKV